MIYYIVDCMHMEWTSYGEPKRTEIVFHREYERLADAQKEFEKYKPRELGNDTMRLTLYRVDTSVTDEDGFYSHGWIKSRYF